MLSVDLRIAFAAVVSTRSRSRSRTRMPMNLWRITLPQLLQNARVGPTIEAIHKAKQDVTALTSAT